VGRLVGLGDDGLKSHSVSSREVLVAPAWGARNLESFCTCVLFSVFVGVYAKLKVSRCGDIRLVVDVRLSLSSSLLSSPPSDILLVASWHSDDGIANL
jgi:hypothetical protein